MTGGDMTEPFDGAECPFCAADDPLVWFAADAQRWAVFCQVCEAEGPHSDDRIGAISQWNNRFVEART